MAVPDRSIDPRILKSAKKEFLNNGFEKASLKAICDGADITTGALYNRYKGKEDLFSALVEETVHDLYAVLAQKNSIDAASLSDEQLIKAWDMDEDYMLWWFEFLEQHHDGFALLLKCTEGTAYSNFQHDWVEQMTHATGKYLEEAQRRGLADQSIDPAELHILLTAFWTTIYEPFIHGFSWNQIKKHCRLVCRLFDWKNTLKLGNPG
ncbi:TetR/AcrR family transcriptional regulator [Ruminococcus sp. OA3]|uniref:TetR/AcrR family transcriptional regulator n=1 Tax=Ruminococcus sp. OA3 TaxID=2914164 RepID=UPI001F070115|nr:TetR/AcrR family transcriptional regulator [Ruminococcus sp. OA3]MCH1983133.1 TetR/AcrR family transcriptional regulator [Ruminococcus sp. OA3]